MAAETSQPPVETPPVERPAVLEIETLLPKDVVKVDGVKYELRQPDQLLSLFDYTRFERLLDRVLELTSKDEITPAENDELERAADRMTRIVLDAPEAVHAKLTPRQRMKVIMSFHRLPTTNEQTPAAKVVTEAPLTGANGSPDSNASTEATQPVG